jgi:hypothetical protein
VPVRELVQNPAIYLEFAFFSGGIGKLQPDPKTGVPVRELFWNPAISLERASASGGIRDTQLSN